MLLVYRDASSKRSTERKEMNVSSLESHASLTITLALLPPVAAT